MALKTKAPTGAPLPSWFERGKSHDGAPAPQRIGPAEPCLSLPRMGRVASDLREPGGEMHEDPTPLLAALRSDPPRKRGGIKRWLFENRTLTL
jgi:hypothetical protein